MLHWSQASLIYFIIGVAAAISCVIYIRSLQHTYTDFDVHFKAIIPDVIKPLNTITKLQPNENANANVMTGAAVIVVGSGLAGLAAAYEALKAGAKVHMFDRAAKPGGNSIKASSGINGAGTRFQKEKGILDDSSDKFYEDSEKSAGRRFREKSGAPGTEDRKTLVKILTDGSVDAVHWLADEVGVDLTTVAMLGGHGIARTHRGSLGPPPGAAIVGALVKKLSENERFTLTPEADVEALLTDDASGNVVGVRYKKAGLTLDDTTSSSSSSSSSTTHEVLGPVVFAAGGFAGDATGLLAKHRPDLAGLPSTNEARPAPHGILKAVGAELVDMDAVQVHPTGFVDPRDPEAAYKFLAAEALRGEGGVLLDARSGGRVVDELGRRDFVSAVVMGLGREEEGEGQGEGKLANGLRMWDVLLVLDPGAAEAVASHLGFYLFKGLMKKVKLRDLEANVLKSLRRYAGFVEKGKDEEFGRKSFGAWRLRPEQLDADNDGDIEVVVGRVTPVTHFTMGGVAFDEKARVLGKKKGGKGRGKGRGKGKGDGNGDGDEGLKAIEGLWAAGEITGGIHGDNRLGGSSLLECVVFGRIAGVEAARSLESSG